MAAELRAGLPIIRSNTGEVCVKYSRYEDAKASVLYAGTHCRGGSNSLVWVSEWGTIQATDIARSEEILTGALPSFGDGICVIDAVPRPLSVETRRYFEGKQGLSLSPGQMSWYQRKRDELGAFILREYPSTLGECFQSPVEGAIYAELIDKLRGRKRDQTMESRPLGPGPHVLGLRKPGQYLRLVLPGRGRRDSRYRPRHGSRSDARRACGSHFGQRIFV